jgi:hypothetical protein
LIFPAIGDAADQIDAVFLNTAPVIECPKLLPSNYFYVGNMVAAPAKPLPAEYTTWAKPTAPVVYISFGRYVTMQYHDFFG